MKLAADVFLFLKICAFLLELVSVVNGQVVIEKMENFSNYTRIIDLKEGQRNLNIRAIILEIKIVKTRAKQEDYYVLIIADQTAKVNCKFTNLDSF